jgi:hypothetical protein
VLATGAATALATGFLAGCGEAAHPGSGTARYDSLSIAPRPAMTAPATPLSATPSGTTAVPGFVPLSFTAVSATDWWVLGSVPCRSRDCPAIVTTDGGATFQPRPAPGGPFGRGLDLPAAARSIRFADSSDGWAFGPALYATHDGGRHWTAISMPGAVTELAPGLGEVFASSPRPLDHAPGTGRAPPIPPRPGCGAHSHRATTGSPTRRQVLSAPGLPSTADQCGSSTP